MSVQRWKPSWAQGRMIPAGVHPVDGYVSAADHAASSLRQLPKPEQRSVAIGRRVSATLSRRTRLRWLRLSALTRLSANARAA